MAKTKKTTDAINKQAVFEVASAIAKRYEMPTIKKIREQLDGRGSETTLHKYLSLWKKELLDLVPHLYDKSFKTLEAESFNVENIALETALKAETTKSKILAEELINCERKNSQLQDDLAYLRKELEEALQQNQGLLLKSSQLETLLQELKEERKNLLEAVLSDKNKQIAALQQELKEMNQDNLNELKKIGFETDESILLQKVKVINLEDKLEALTKEIESLKTKLKKERERHLPLIQQLHKQKAFIQKIVSGQQIQEVLIK